VSINPTFACNKGGKAPTRRVWSFLKGGKAPTRRVWSFPETGKVQHAAFGAFPKREKSNTPRLGLSKQITEKLLHPSNQPALSTLVSLPAYAKEQEFSVTDIIKALLEFFCPATKS
jgi:hypothetical protein